MRTILATLSSLAGAAALLVAGRADAAPAAPPQTLRDMVRALETELNKPLPVDPDVILGTVAIEDKTIAARCLLHVPQPEAANDRQDLNYAIGTLFLPSALPLLLQAPARGTGRYLYNRDTGHGAAIRPDGLLIVDFASTRLGDDRLLGPLATKAVMTCTAKAGIAPQLITPK